jgi:hypothetical protein
MHNTSKTLLSGLELEVHLADDHDIERELRKIKATRYKMAISIHDPGYLERQPALEVARYEYSYDLASDLSSDIRHFIKTNIGQIPDGISESDGKVWWRYYDGIINELIIYAIRCGGCVRGINTNRTFGVDYSGNLIYFQPGGNLPTNPYLLRRLNTVRSAKVNICIECFNDDGATVFSRSLLSERDLDSQLTFFNCIFNKCGIQFGALLALAHLVSKSSHGEPFEYNSQPVAICRDCGRWITWERGIYDDSMVVARCFSCHPKETYPTQTPGLR